MTTIKKHRATASLPAPARGGNTGGAHRASRMAELLFASGLGMVLIVLLAVLATRS